VCRIIYRAPKVCDLVGHDGDQFPPLPTGFIEQFEFVSPRQGWRGRSMMPACRAPSPPHLLCGSLAKKEAHSRVPRGNRLAVRSYTAARQLSWEQESARLWTAPQNGPRPTIARSESGWEKIVRCCAARPEDGGRSSAPVDVIIGLKGSRLRSWISAAISLTMRLRPLRANRMRSRSRIDERPSEARGRAAARGDRPNRLDGDGCRRTRYRSYKTRYGVFTTALIAALHHSDRDGDGLIDSGANTAPTNGHGEL
jgi:hypothetical protein